MLINFLALMFATLRFPYILMSGLCIAFLNMYQSNPFGFRFDCFSDKCAYFNTTKIVCKIGETDDELFTSPTIAIVVLKSLIHHFQHTPPCCTFWRVFYNNFYLRFTRFFVKCLAFRTGRKNLYLEISCRNHLNNLDYCAS